jgi:hypothetical protein
LDAARVVDGVRAKDGQARVGSGELRRRVSLGAVMTAVAHEGRVVLEPGGEEYWVEQEKHYHGAGMGSRDGTRNRFGRVTWRRVYR